MLVPPNQVDKHHKIHSRNVEVMPQTVIMETVDKFPLRHSMGLTTNRTSHKKNEPLLPKSTLGKSNNLSSKSFVFKKAEKTEVEVQSSRMSLLSKRKASGNSQLYQTIPPKQSKVTASKTLELKKPKTIDKYPKKMIKENQGKMNRTILEGSEQEEQKVLANRSGKVNKDYSKIVKMSKKENSLNETLDQYNSREDKSGSSIPRRSFVNSKSHKEYATMSVSNLQSKSEHERANFSSQHKRTTLKMNNLTSVAKLRETEVKSDNRKPKESESKEKTLTAKKTNPKNLNKQIKTLQSTISRTNRAPQTQLKQQRKHAKNNVFNLAINEQLYQKDTQKSVKIVEALSISDEIGSLISSATATKLKDKVLEDDCFSRTTKPRLSDCTQTITAEKLNRLPLMTLEEKKHLVAYDYTNKNKGGDLGETGLDKSEKECLSSFSPVKVIVLLTQ
eukprot:TRINITY_DN2249_c0_g1_i5.p1 TRINITY_DN2249_c0_g1~~TRINITY_DN2249_c0_g1_i5.p1  ORF type:complete len:447 (+),score=119.87 TRINITY_DN2249_c0_g1_i5:1737-3077(+)